MAQRSRSQVMTADNLNGSENYVWSTSSFLGRGSTAVVYQGVHKSTGEPAAVKTFTASTGLQAAQINELELLKKLDHENVVKLLAIEKEVQTDNKVAIMELCEGRSLFNILDDPENAFGLNEKEFLLVLEHMSAGMKYLRDNFISHRDLKPGNIVKFITDDGRHIYKLTDFGAARALTDDEYFTSLCGTEEYLYPDIYDKAVMKSSEKKLFSPKVDLWSMGCTIYHVATGSLPFRPYRGRENRHGMQFIHTNKPRGVISAIQYENGRVEWSKELPKTCLLSHGLREVVTPLLQQLLEKDKTLTFHDFFKEVDKFLAKKPVYVFDAQTCTEHTLYMDPTETVRDLHSRLDLRTQIPPDNQLLIFKGQALDYLNSSNPAATSIQSTSQDEPIILINNSNMAVKPSAEKTSPPTVNFPDFDKAGVSLDHDVLKAKNFTSAAYVIGRNIERLSQCHRLLLKIPPAVITVITQKIEQVHQLMTQSLDRVSSLDSILKSLDKYVETFLELAPLLKLPKCPELQRLPTITNDRRQGMNSVMEVLDSVQERATSLQTKYMPSQRQDNRWQKGLENCNNLHGCKETAETYVKVIRSCWQTLDKFKSMIPLSFNEEQFKQLEKNKMIRTKEKLLALNNRCITSLQQACSELDLWYSEPKAAFVQCQCLTVELNHGVALLKTFEISLKKGQNECEELVTKLIKMSKNQKKETADQPVNVTNGIKSDEVKKYSSSLLKELQDLKDSQNGLRYIVKENHAMVDEFQSLAAHLASLRPDDSTLS